MSEWKTNPNDRFMGRATCASADESGFRWQVRQVLDLDWSTRDDAILRELARLKQLDTQLSVEPRKQR